MQRQKRLDFHVHFDVANALKQADSRVTSNPAEVLASQASKLCADFVSRNGAFSQTMVTTPPWLCGLQLLKDNHIPFHVIAVITGDAIGYAAGSL